MKSRTVEESAAALGDKACIYCGASLAGLTAHDRCPDCGKPAVDSLLQNYLRDADHEWLRTILRGISLMAIGMAGVVVAALLAIVPVFVRPQVLDPSLVRQMILLGGMAILALGLWFLTAAEPADSLVARRRGLAVTIRLATILGLMGLSLEFARAVIPPQAHQSSMMAGWLGALLTFSLPWIYLRRLNDRTPRQEVSRLLRTTFWLSVVVLLIGMSANIGRPYLADERIRHYLPAAEALVWAAFNGFGIYVLAVTSHGIRRTVGYWT